MEQQHSLALDERLRSSGIQVFDRVRIGWDVHDEMQPLRELLATTGDQTLDYINEPNTRRGQLDTDHGHMGWAVVLDRRADGSFTGYGDIIVQVSDTTLIDTGVRGTTGGGQVLRLLKIIPTNSLD